MGDVLKLLYPPAPAPAPATTVAPGAAPGPPRREGRGEAEAEVGKEVEEVKVEEEVEEEVEEVVICKLERAVEAAEGRAATAGGGGERPGVKAGARGGRGRAFPESGQRRRRGGPRRRSSVFGLY